MEPLRLLANRRVRERTRRERRMRLFLIASLVFAIIIGVYVGIRQASFFKVTEIRVLGLNRAGEISAVTEHLKAVVSRRSLARLFGMDHVLSWPNFYQSDATGLPFLAEVSLSRNFFTRRIEIVARPRERFGVWCLRGKETSCFWFDGEQGILFEETPVPDGNIIPTVLENRETVGVLGEDVLDEERLARLLTIFDFLDSSRFAVRTVLFERALDEIILYFAELPKVRVSLRFDPEEILSAFEEFTKSRNLDAIETVDLTVEHKLYWSP